MKHWATILVLGWGLAAGAAAQMPAAVTAARSAGAIGERFDGYLGFARPPSPALRQAVNGVNIKRRALYSDLATKRRVAPSDVGVTAGCEMLARVAVGEAYLLQDGRWRVREAGEGPPVPAYCRP